MYISVEVRNGLCEAGAIVCAMLVIAAAIVIVLPWIVRRTSYLRCRARMWLRYRRDLALIKRDERRYRAAMKVFDKPVIWREM